MIFVKIISLFCLVAMALAFCADTVCLVLARSLGGFGIFAKPSGWFTLFSVFWVFALVIGWLLVRRFHFFPIELVIHPR